MPLGLFHFQVLYNVLENIHFIHNEDELAKTVMETVSKALNAEGGSIFKIMPDKQTLYPLASYGAPIEALRKMKFAVGKGVVGWVAQYSQPLKVDKPNQDARFMGMIDKNTGFTTKTLLAAPIISKGQCVGVIEFINRKDGPFAAPDLELVSMVGREVGIAFENAQLFQHLEQSRAFEESILNSLSAGVLVVDKEGHLMRVNPSAQKILDLDFDDEAETKQLYSKALSAFPSLIAVLEDVVQSETPLIRKELNMQIGAKSALIGYSGVPIVNRSGARLGSALLFQDITAFLSAPTSSRAPAKA